MLSVTVLGCGGTYAGPDNACSGYLVESGATRLWLDTGPGTLANLLRHRALPEIDAIVLSHEHPDHWLDLPVVRNVLRYVLGDASLPVFGTAGTRVMAEALLEGRLDPALRWTTVTDGDRVEVGDLEVSFSRTDHPVETLAMQCRAGDTSLVYTADTGPGWEPAELGAEPDAVLCEATLGDGEAGSAPHLSGGEAGERATRAGAGRLLLTHLLPGTDGDRRLEEATATFDGPIELVNVNGRYDL